LPCFINIATKIHLNRSLDFLPGYHLMSTLSVTNVSKQFPTRGEPLQVLRDVSLEMKAGENLAILGPSGCGKSTLLHLLGTLDAPTSGTIKLNDQDPFALEESQLARFRNENIGFIFQEHHLLPQLSVLENVLVPAMATGTPSEELVQRAHDLISRVGLENRLSHRPAELSGGERERAAVARSLLHRPLLLLADEPTGNLDRTNAQQVAQLLLEIQQQEQTMLVVVTHNNELADQLQKQTTLDNGQLS
jgi:lipoprotein-releasing system ATP-binding protein